VGHIDGILEELLPTSLWSNCVGASRSHFSTEGLYATINFGLLPWFSVPNEKRNSGSGATQLGPLNLTMLNLWTVFSTLPSQNTRSGLGFVNRRQQKIASVLKGPVQ
jgi:hypothetical protein